MSIETIGLLTSGGDAPGMNAAIRAVVRTAINKNKKAIGIYHGYSGLIDGKYQVFDKHMVSNILQKGGTILKSARSKEFRTPEGRAKAYENIKKMKLDCLIAIGGDGTFQGCEKLYNEYNFPVIGIPATIDNNLYGTDFCIGYDTALNTALSALDRLRDTADAHDRLFFVEVMGGNSGYLAMETGIACGAEKILLPETYTDFEDMNQELNNILKTHKRSGIVIVAEGDESGGALEVVKRFQQKFKNYDVRIAILGHIQRGGNPTARDRILASHLGYQAVNVALKKQTNTMVGIRQGRIELTPLKIAHQKIKSLPENSIILPNILR